MFGIGPMELVLILVVALLVFGPKRLPELARTLGRGLGEFRQASNELRQSLALDDLQNELRTGMSGRTIARPDRPAQAGDDLAPGQADADPAPGEPAETGAAGAASAAGEADQSAAASEEGASDPPQPISGQLPFGNEYDHHDEAEDASSGEDDTGGRSQSDPQRG